MKNLFKLLYLVFFTIVIGGVFSAYTGVSPSVSVLATGAAMAVSGLYQISPNVLMGGPDLSAIARYAHQFQKSLITTLVNGLDVVNDILVLPNVKTSIKLPKLAVGNGFRPYSATTEFYTGDADYTDRELKVDVGKREMLVDPEAYRQTYLSLTLGPGSGANKMEIPFAQYLWGELINSLKREINDETVYFGFDKTTATAYVDAVTTYTAGDYVTYPIGGITEYFLCLTNTSAGEDPVDTPAKWRNVTARAVVPGIKSHIDTAISGGGLVATATGAITATAGVAVTAFLKLFRAMPVAYKNQGVIIHCSYTDFEFLLDDLVNNFKYTLTDVSAFAQNGLMPLPGSDRKGWVKPATWLTGSRRLIAEPMMNGKGGNLVMGTDVLGDANEIKTLENLWTLEAGVKFVLGFQISNLDSIKVGDQA